MADRVDPGVYRMQAADLTRCQISSLPNPIASSCRRLTTACWRSANRATCMSGEMVLSA
jgi:hypothetical protein